MTGPCSGKDRTWLTGLLSFFFLQIPEPFQPASPQFFATNCRCFIPHYALLMQKVEKTVQKCIFFVESNKKIRHF